MEAAEKPECLSRLCGQRIGISFTSTAQGTVIKGIAEDDARIAESYIRKPVYDLRRLGRPGVPALAEDPPCEE
jgi:hypothetical protein